MTTDLKTRIESGDLHFLDGLVLLGTIASQRWFGGKSRDVLDARVLDAGVVPGGPPLLALAIVEVRYGLQTHDLYHLPLGFRPSDDGWDEQVDRGGRGLDRLRRARRSRARPPDRRARPRRRAARPRRGDDRLLSLRHAARRGRDGPADGRRAVEQLARPRRAARAQVLPPDRAGDEPGARGPPLPHLPQVPARRSPRGLRHLRGQAARGDARDPAARSSRRNGDGWELALETLGSDPGWLPGARAPARRGDREAAQHARLRSDRPALRARGAEHGVARADLGDDRRGDRAGVRGVAGHPGARAGGRTRRGGARPAPHADAHRAGRKDHPPPRRLPPRPGAVDERRGLADPRLRGRARAHALRAAAEALAAAGRRRDAALVRLRGLGVGDPARRRSRRRAGRRSAGPSSSAATSARSSRRCCRTASRRSSAC